MLFEFQEKDLYVAKDEKLKVHAYNNPLVHQETALFELCGSFIL